MPDTELRAAFKEASKEDGFLHFSELIKAFISKHSAWAVLGKLTRLAQPDCMKRPYFNSPLRRQHREAVLYCLIVGLSESLIASLVHPLRLRWEVMEDVLPAAKAFPNFARVWLGIEERRPLARRVVLRVASNSKRIVFRIKKITKEFSGLQTYN